MGVRGLFKFLKRFEKQVSIPEFIQNKSVGIDIFWFLHKSKGDVFYLQNAILPIIKYASKIYCVFDGRPSQEKRQLLQEQAIKRQEINQSIEQIEKFLKHPFNHLRGEDRKLIHDYLLQLKRQIWQPSPEYIDHIISWLQSKGCEVYKAPEEADAALIDLEQNGLIDIIITNDSDLLTRGSKLVMRPVTPLRASIYDRNYMCDLLGFTHQQWLDFMYLCQHIRENDIILAFSLISVYKDLEYGLEKYFRHYNEHLVENLRINV